MSSEHTLDAAVARESEKDPLPPAGPVDGDWADRERAAKGKLPPPLPDDNEEDEPYGDPASVKDEGLLKSLGKAVSSPVKEAAEEDGHEPPGR